MASGLYPFSLKADVRIPVQDLRKVYVSNDKREGNPKQMMEAGVLILTAVC